MIIELFSLFVLSQKPKITLTTFCKAPIIQEQPIIQSQDDINAYYRHTAIGQPKLSTV